MKKPPTIKAPFYEGFLRTHFPGLAERREKSRLGIIEASVKGGVATRLSESWPRTEGTRFQNDLERFETMSARDRGYHCYRNNLVAKTLIDTEVDNVIGDGLNFHPTSSSEEWNREAIDKYYEWLEVANVEGPHRVTGCEMLRGLWTYSRVAGDIGWMHVTRGNESRVQIVPSQNIVTPDADLADRRIKDGILFSRLRRPLAYSVLTYDETTGERDFKWIKADDFNYLPHFGATNAARGETAYAHVFDHLTNFDRYVDGVSLAAWMATVFGIIFKQSNSAKQVAQLSEQYNAAGDLQKAITFEGGQAKYIGTDDEVAQVQAHQPMQQTPDFIRALLRLAGMVFGQPLEAFARDMSTCNFASARIGLIPFYRRCLILGQGTFAPRWSRTTQWWLSRERLRADGDPKKWITPFPVDFKKHEFRSNAWTYTDPVKEAQGDLLELDMETKSPQMVIQERGRDAARILQDWEEWDAARGNRPRRHSTMTRDPAPEAPATPPANKEKTDDDDE